MMKKALIFVPIVLVVAYLGLALFFNTRFLPNTYINNINVGAKTVESAKEAVKESGEAGKIELVKNDGTSEIIDLSSLNYTAKVESDINEILMQQNSFSWIINMFSKEAHTADISFTYDTNGIEDIIGNLKCVTSQKVSAPQDAYIKKTDFGYEIVPETEGSMIEKDKLVDAVLDAITNGEDVVNLSQAGCYKKAEITTQSESILQFSRLLENINSLTITYDFSDRTETLTSEQLNQWITIEDYQIIVNEDMAKQYITNLAYKYDTYLTDREFTTTDGETITVGGGIYGWQTDVEKSTEELIAAIKNCESVTIQPSYKISGLCRDTNDIGDTYVEVSIEKQHVWYYKDGELFMETDCVTGLPNGRRDTPKGLFCIWSREKDRTLGSYAVQGYESFVNFWMPIDWTGVGLHDATWRGSFGGTIYKTNGSHGCINMPYDAAKKIFDNAVTGTPVVIY